MIYNIITIVAIFFDLGGFMFRLFFRFLILSLVVLLVPGLVKGQHFEYVRTGQNASILIEDPTVADNPMGVGDEIAVFDPQGTCAGACVIEDPDERHFGLVAWGDDPETDADEGFEERDQFVFRIWDADLALEFGSDFEVTNGEEIFITNGFSIIRIFSDGIARMRVDNEFEFGNVLLNQNEQFAIPISNTGNGNLVIEELRLNGDDEVFAIDFGDEPVLIRPEADYELPVEFSPDHRGGFSAIVTLVTNADPSEVEIDISAAGIAPAIINITREDINFGTASTVEDPENHTPQVVIDSLMIMSEGDLSLELTQFSIAPAGQFFFDRDMPEMITAGFQESIYIPLKFDPSENGELSAVLTFSTNDPDRPEVQITLTGIGITPDGVRMQNPEVISTFQIASVYPNPFNSTTLINYHIPQAGLVTVAVFDLQGRQIAQLFSGLQTTGKHMLLWNGQNHAGYPSPSGTYLIRVVSANEIVRQSVMLLR